MRSPFNSHWVPHRFLMGPAARTERGARFRESRRAAFATGPMFARTLTELQAELSALSPNSLHFTVDGAAHESLVAERERALVVVDAFREILKAARAGEHGGGTDGDAMNVIRAKPGGCWPNRLSCGIPRDRG